MVLSGKKFVAIAGVLAGVVATTAATPIQARGCRCVSGFHSGGFHRHRVNRFGPGVSYVYGGYGRPVVASASFARAVARYYALGYGGYLRYHYENGALVPEYYGIPVPAPTAYVVPR